MKFKNYNNPRDGSAKDKIAELIGNPGNLGNQAIPLEKRDYGRGSRGKSMDEIIAELERKYGNGNPGACAPCQIQLVRVREFDDDSKDDRTSPVNPPERNIYRLIERSLRQAEETIPI